MEDSIFKEMRRMRKGMDSLFDDFFYGSPQYLLEDSEK
jgi:hypothetical protein